MEKIPESNPLIKQPTAWIPMAISFAALTFLVGYIAIFGIDNSPGKDEGAPARIFQLLMAAQLPVIAFFALQWLPKRPKQALLILGVQVVAWMIPIVTVIYLESL